MVYKKFPLRGLETTEINGKLSSGVTKVGAMRGLGVCWLTEDTNYVCKDASGEGDTSVSHTSFKSRLKSALSTAHALNWNWATALIETNFVLSSQVSQGG